MHDAAITELYIAELSQPSLETCLKCPVHTMYRNESRYICCNCPYNIPQTLKCLQRLVISKGFFANLITPSDSTANFVVTNKTLARLMLVAHLILGSN